MTPVDKMKNPKLEIHEKKGLVFVFKKIIELHNANSKKKGLPVIFWIRFLGSEFLSARDLNNLRNTLTEPQDQSSTTLKAPNHRHDFVKA